MLDASADHITDGFVFAFKAMGSVLPIAGFFFLGAGDTSGAILGIDAKDRTCCSRPSAACTPDARGQDTGGLRRAAGGHDHRHRWLGLCRPA
jgi:hypothetical protein